MTPKDKERLALVKIKYKAEIMLSRLETVSDRLRKLIDMTEKQLNNK